ncbi:GGDEF domain-containing protein [Deinococcus maricopensis]|uniref:Diguanylate cyclase n=1 Tax=Deinococcus maricopensis (strain DSM 21211 / LMG 22137 / NRRL B-23946 / LB-34) TaxID=709986 RepID=E8UAH6_DEIML|nr:GGDEF domain-containing protein [Deinococcus maricopensis]ADV68065.1 diguanylate cyclase [Deinococcus maricopensis DSM 21211]
MPVRPARPRLDPHVEFQRHALLSIIAIAFVTSVVTLGVALTLGWNVGDRLGLTILTLKNAALLAWLLWRREQGHAVAVGIVYFVTLAATGLWKFHDALLVQQAANGLGHYSYWLPLAYLVPFLVFRPAWALGSTLTVFAALLGMGVAFWVSPVIPEATKTAHVALLVQMYLTHVTFLSFLALHDVLLRRYVRTVQQARSEALLANLDALTGLPNRRQLLTWLGEHVPVQTDAPLSVILFDLDHFKRVNDTFGHDVGDDVLRATAAVMGGALRRETPFGRWGGEEFLVVLPGADVAHAQAVAERVRSALASGPMTRAGRVTASFGVTQAQPGESVEGVLKRADDALYAAKHAGRDQVLAA